VTFSTILYVDGPLFENFFVIKRKLKFFSWRLLNVQPEFLSIVLTVDWPNLIKKNLIDKNETLNGGWLIIFWWWKLFVLKIFLRKLFFIVFVLRRKLINLFIFSLHFMLYYLNILLYVTVQLVNYCCYVKLGHLWSI